MVKKTEKGLVPKSTIKNALKGIEQEIVDEYVQGVRTKAKNLVKEIRQLEIIINKKKKQLEEIMSGEKQYSEESILFED